MIYGIGIDIVKIERMKKVAEKWGEKFLERVFSEGEIAYCSKKKNPYLSLAVRFAAKEAFIKAISSEVAVTLTEIEVMNDDGGKPSIKLSGRLQDFFETNHIKTAHLSLSHEHEYGVACVILEQQP
jgi:phosphopantetheine--protein transferase-like protein